MTIIKICGITNLEDALGVVRCGADAVGFNFYPGSPRSITPEQVRAISDQLPGGILKVGVFVNASVEEITRTAALIGLTAVQLHGDETTEFVNELNGECDLQIIKAFRVSKGFMQNDILAYDVDGILLDAYSPNEYGGTGETFNWETARQVRRIAAKMYLAGGLSAENVSQAINEVRPYAVDACSRLESAPGKKDIRKVERFISEVRRTG